MTTCIRPDATARQTVAPSAKAALPLILLFAALLLAANATLFVGNAQADIVAGTTSTENAENAESSGPVGIYAGFPSETSWSEDLSSLFYYSDSLFTEPAGT